MLKSGPPSPSGDAAMTITLHLDDRGRLPLPAERGSDGFVTTDEVLIEFLTFFAEQGPRWRESAVRLVQAVFGSAEVEVVPQSRDSFRAGLELYSRRPDKGYSLTDCVSMSTM